MLVTLTTDFGLADGYVAAMKGALLRVAPGACLVDVSHAVAAQDVMGAAFVLAQAVPHMPDGTVHLAVVDPDVGTERRGIAAHAALPTGETFRFVGADNGLLALLVAETGAEVLEAVVLDRPEAWGTAAPSRTFHGRDVFAPVAARLARGAALTDVGTPTDETTRLHWPLPMSDEQGIGGMVLHVDRYGNCITNIPRAEVERLGAGRAVTCYVGTAILRGLRGTYAEASAGEALALYGSTGLLEIAVNGGDAAALLSVRRGAAVNLLFGSPATAAPRAAAARRRGAQPRTLA